LGGAIVSGLLLALSLPPFHFWYLAFFALVPFLVTVRHSRFSFGIFAGLLTALVGASALAFGILPVPNPSHGEPNWIFGGYLLFGLVLGIVGGIWSEQKELKFVPVVLTACLAITTEAALMVILPVHLALSQSEVPASLKLSSVTGIWGVSFLIWGVNLWLATVPRKPSRLWIAPASAVVACIVVSAVVPFSSAPPDGPVIGVLQTMTNDLHELAATTELAATRGAQLVVWPELSSMAAAPRGDTRELKTLSSTPHEPAFITSFEDDATPKPHNTAALFYRGAESSRYYKRKPFAGEATMHQAGTRAAIGNWDVPVGLNICFDSCHPSVLRDTADLGANFIALPTEDPVSSGGVVQAIHAAYTPFRSAELGLSIARADITADSMITGADGRILVRMGGGEGFVVSRVDKPRMTVYRRLGDWFLYACLLATIYWIARSVVAKLASRKGT
jgi:apolipoprotein N-acyltransferase